MSDTMEPTTCSSCRATVLVDWQNGRPSDRAFTRFECNDCILAGVKLANVEKVLDQYKRGMVTRREAACRMFELIGTP